MNWRDDSSQRDRDRAEPGARAAEDEAQEARAQRAFLRENQTSPRPLGWQHTLTGPEWAAQVDRAIAHSRAAVRIRRKARRV